MAHQNRTNNAVTLHPLFSEFKVCGNWFVRIDTVLYLLESSIKSSLLSWRTCITSMEQLKVNVSL